MLRKLAKAIARDWPTAPVSACIRFDEREFGCSAAGVGPSRAVPVYVGRRHPGELEIRYLKDPLDETAAVAAEVDDLLLLDSVSAVVGLAIERKLVEEELRLAKEESVARPAASEDRYRLLADSMGDALLLIDIDTTRIVEVNRTATDFYGREREELIGLPAAELVVDGYSALIEERMSEVIAKGFGIFESEHRSAKGPVPVEINTKVIDLDGRGALLHVVRDASRRV